MNTAEWGKCYNFLSQNVFLTDISPTQIGVVDEDRIFIVYENFGRIEIYKVNDVQQSKTHSHKSNDQASLKEQMEHETNSSYVLELTIPLFDVDIVQVIHCSIYNGYFALYTNNRLNKAQSVRVYSNWKNHITNDYSELEPLAQSTTHSSSVYPFTNCSQQLFSVRLAGELYNLINNDPKESQRLFHKISQCLNVLELTDRSRNDLPVQFISRCKTSGTLVVTLRNSKVMLYRHVQCISNNHQSDIHTIEGDGKQTTIFKLSDLYAIDFIYSHTVVLLESSWIPEVAKLSLNYLALMSRGHFSLLRLQFYDEEKLNEESFEHKSLPLIIKFNSFKKHTTARQADDFILRDDVQIIFDSLFETSSKDIPNCLDCSNEKCHSEIVYGPVSGKLTCKFAVFSHQATLIQTKENVTDSSNKISTASSNADSVDDIEEEFHLLFCRGFKSIKDSSYPSRQKGSRCLNNEQIDLLELGCLKARSISLLGGEFKKSFHFGFDLAPILDHNSGLIIAHCLYILHGFELDCYLVDLRRDSLKLVPISHLILTDRTPKFGSFVSIPIIRDICFCPQEDVIHILSSQSLKTYCTHFYDFLATNSPQNMNRTRNINTSPLMLACNHFLHQIALLSNGKFLFLVSKEGEINCHTIYGLRRPDPVDLQQDTNIIIDELLHVQTKDSSTKDILKQLFQFTISNCKFALQHNRLSQSEQDNFKAIIEKINTIARME